MISAAKENPAKTILGMSGSIIAVVVALFSLDARYAHAADVEKMKQETQEVIKQTAIVLRKQSIEDKLFEYDLKKEEAEAKGKKLSPTEIAVQKRYKRQLEDLKAGKILE
jgi:hypothetical protein